MRVRSAGLFLERVVNHCYTPASIKLGYVLQPTHTQLQTSASRTPLCLSLCSDLHFKRQSMKRRRLLSLPLLPTITETLEDLPVHPSSSSQSTQSSQSLEDYMTSIQALARPAEVPSHGPVRLHRSPRLRQLSKAQMKLSVSVTRASPRTLRTSRSSGLNSNSSEDFSIKMSREQSCRGQDPVDWLFGQTMA